MSFHKTRISISLIFAMHLFGAAMIGGDFIKNFVLLTPFNLLASLGLVLWGHEEWSPKFLLIAALCFFTGLTAEILGTNTGLIFGEYTYGRTLGWKIFNTPLIIGVNWLLLVYAAAALVNHFIAQQHPFWKSLLGAGLMVGLDFFIEPVAMRYDFWDWEGGVVPLQNYIAWFIIAFALLLVVHSFLQIKNKIAIALFFGQLLFFVLLFLQLRF